MAPSWSSRFLPSSSNSSSNAPSRQASNEVVPQQQQRTNKHLPSRPPPPGQAYSLPSQHLPPYFDPPPTLFAERPQQPSASPRPHTSSGRQHNHGRSVSHPLPKIFGRKKSERNLGGFNDTDVPFDSDDLVPTLDNTQSAAAGTPTRVISGKRGGGLGREDEGKAMRQCMCCDCKLSVPKDLEKFRCQVCLTINDLRPVAEQRNGGKSGIGSGVGDAGERAPQQGGFPHGIKGPLSVERTRAVIDRCVTTYLEARCRRQEPVATAPPAAERGELRPMPGSPRAVSTPVGNASSEPAPSHAMPIRPRDQSGQGKQLVDAPLSSSPPDTPENTEDQVSHSATIRDYRDIDMFGMLRTDTPPQPQPNAHGPGPPPTPGPSSMARKPIPAKPNRKPPPPPVNVTNRTPSQKLHPNGSSTPTNLPSPRPQLSPRPNPGELRERARYERVKTIFRPLEDYILASFGDYDLLNTAFSTIRPTIQGRTLSESSIKTPPPEPESGAGGQDSPFGGIDKLDHKALLVGDLGENSSWWIGKLDRIKGGKEVRRKKVGEGGKKPVSSRSPNLNWAELSRWYDLVHTAGEQWRMQAGKIKAGANDPAAVAEKRNLDGAVNEDEIEDELEEAREHVLRMLFKVTENILKRPSRPLKEPEQLRFLLIILAHPSLYPSRRRPNRAVSGASTLQPVRTLSDGRGLAPGQPYSPSKQPSPQKSPHRNRASASGPQHTGILKRVFGLLANSTEQCHRYLIGWFARYDQDRFESLVALTASFVTHRISRRSTGGRRLSKSGAVDDGGLIPDLSGSAANTSAQLHAAMGLGGGSVKKGGSDVPGETEWANDWQVKAAAKVMSLLFAANNIWQGKRRDMDTPRVDSGVALNARNPEARAARSGQLMHTSQFYNLMLDYHDLIADFKVWESKRDKFAFCQYPLFLSMGAKIRILEYDARRQMESRAREAYFTSVMRFTSDHAADGHFHLRVRRECMVEDSLRQISEADGADPQELKKGLRVHFNGEEGIDAGGPRKEWFLMLVREIFDPEHGMFVYDDESRTCYFNPNSFETSDQYKLVGTLLGLAIYNSTILDVAFPPFVFRKLLAAAPLSAVGGGGAIGSITGTKGQMTYTISDLAEFRPRLAAGLQQLLDFEGDVESTYCWNFVAPVERYGVVSEVPLVSNGEGIAVTNANRQEFVEAYIRYLLDTSVARQFEPFKRGFFAVCAGNALSLFRAEEIELLVRGSEEELDVDSLRAVAAYENWRSPTPPHQLIPEPGENVPVIGWFWDIFKEAGAERQRKLLTFITGSDRIPAVGATSLVLRVVAGGDGFGGGGEEERKRFPVARTCFNMLVLWRYHSREALDRRLWRAVEESEGFGLK